jgi:tetratricopeptide (TPR) repeat protein
VPGVTLYQKPYETLGPDAAARMFTMASLPPVPVVENVHNADEPAHSTAPTLETVRGYASSGAWENAARCCEGTARERQSKGKRTFLPRVGIRADEQACRSGKLAAESSLRKALYLDRQSVLAHYYLGLLLQSRGYPRHAARCFENTLNLLESRHDAHIFTDADGVTAIELKKLAAMHLEILRTQV